MQADVLLDSLAASGRDGVADPVGQPDRGHDHDGRCRALVMLFSLVMFHRVEGLERRHRGWRVAGEYGANVPAAKATRADV